MNDDNPRLEDTGTHIANYDMMPRGTVAELRAEVERLTATVEDQRAALQTLDAQRRDALATMDAMQKQRDDYADRVGALTTQVNEARRLLRDFCATPFIEKRDKARIKAHPIFEVAKRARAWLAANPEVK